ncbi:MAG: Putative glycosyltransferase EpsH [Candidatus Erwinia impunctatus]|nr:Putative glycosyltransferase EpsH [Culicoides impunctatus]
MNTPCFLSILIAVHNGEETLATTLDSIFASLGDRQHQAEIIIINDASVDQTQHIIDDYATRYQQIIALQRNWRNVGKVRNEAVAMAKGDYILMVDADDTLLAGALETRLQILTAQQPDILLSRLIEVRSESAIIPQSVAASPCPLTQHQAITRFLIHRDFQAHFIGQFFARRLFDAYTFPDFICYEDTWLFPVMLMNSQKTLYSSTGFYLYHKRGQSLSAAITAEKIHCLVLATQQLDTVFPPRYRQLIACHWLDIADRYENELRSLPDYALVQQRLAQIDSVRFLCNPMVRLSYKRKWLKVRRRFRKSR